MNSNPNCNTVQEAKYRMQSLFDTAFCLTSNLCPVMLLQPGLKKPISGATGTWEFFDDPAEATKSIEALASLSQCPNLGVMLHPKADSHIVCLDIDGADDRVNSELKSLGVKRDEATWRQVTGKGNGHHHVFYQWAGDPLPRVANKPGRLHLNRVLEKG